MKVAKQCLGKYEMINAMAGESENQTFTSSIIASKKLASINYYARVMDAMEGFMASFFAIQNAKLMNLQASSLSPVTR